jgi:hypothetical protein
MQQRIEDARAAARNTIGAPPVILGEEMTRPSEYLRARCPLCFGGTLVHDAKSKYVSTLSHIEFFILKVYKGRCHCLP